MVVAPRRARVTYPNGDVFEGTFNDAKQKHGSGVYTWATSEGANPWLPEGGLPEGRAVRYEGSWIEGSRAGIGKLFYPNGDRYHGGCPLWGESVVCNGHGHGPPSSPLYVPPPCTLLWEPVVDFVQVLARCAMVVIYEWYAV